VGVVALALLATAVLRLQTDAGSEGREVGFTDDVGTTGGDTILRQTQPAGESGSGGSDDDGNSGTDALRLRRLVNQVGNYSFVYPSTWEFDARGEIAKVSSPDGRLVSSFALGPSRLRSSYEGFVRLLADSYDSVLVQDVKDAKVSGNEALSVRGRGRDGSGRRITFRALLVERRGDRSVGAFAVTVGRSFDGRLADVLSSLRT
jgi:hypothetical protein